MQNTFNASTQTHSYKEFKLKSMWVRSGCCTPR